MALAFPKPAKGAHRAAQLAKRAHEAYVETQAKQAAKARDGHRCRVPGCTTNLRQWRLEAAHIETQGMGGRHSVSANRKDYASVCQPHHTGARSLHSTDLRVTALEPVKGGDGLLRWDELTEHSWRTVGIS